jgi:hypothetical protein
VFLDLAERAGADHPFGIGGELAHGFHIGGEPGQPMGGTLLAIEQAAVRLACHHHPLAHLGHGICQQGIECRGRLAAEFDQFVFGGRAGGGDGHGILGYRRCLRYRLRQRHYACSAQKQSGLGIGGFPASLHGIALPNSYKINHFTL